MVLFYSEASYWSRDEFRLFSALQYPFERLNAIDVADSTTKNKTNQPLSWGEALAKWILKNM